MGKERITRAELSRRVGCSRPYITKLVNQGKIQVGKDGKVNAAAALAAINRFREPGRDHLRKTVPLRGPGAKEFKNAGADLDDLVPLNGKKNGSRDLEELLELRIREGRAKAALRELELREKQGDLIEAEAVHKAAFKTFRALRDALLKIPDRIAPLVTAEKREHKVHKLISSEIREILQGVNHDNGG